MGIGGCSYKAWRRVITELRVIRIILEYYSRIRRCHYKLKERVIAKLEDNVINLGKVCINFEGCRFRISDARINLTES